MINDEAVLAAARVMSDRDANSFKLDKDDHWKMYSQDYIEDALTLRNAVIKTFPKNLGVEL